jgi:hypothetical protein
MVDGKSKMKKLEEKTLYGAEIMPHGIRKITIFDDKSRQLRLDIIHIEVL